MHVFLKVYAVYSEDKLYVLSFKSGWNLTIPAKFYEGSQILLFSDVCMQQAASSKHSYALSWKSTHGNNFSCFYLCREVLKLDLFFFLSSEDVVKRILVIAAWLAIHTVCFFSLCSFIGKENTYVQKKVQLILPYWRDCMVWIKSSQSLFLL